MKKIIKILPVVLMFLLSGCVVNMELWVDNSGGGHGTVSIIGGGLLVTPDQVRAEFKKRGVEVSSINQDEQGNMNVNIKWSDIKRMGKRQPLDNGYVLLDFGKSEAGSITVHVDGKILKEKTTGKLLNPSTVQFGLGPTRLVYLPNPPPGFPIYGVLALGILGILAVAVIFIVRKGKSKQALEVEQTSPTSSDVLAQTPGPAICSDCGTEIRPDHQFCTKCGKKVI